MLTVQSLEPASNSVSPSLLAPLPLVRAHTLSLSKINIKKMLPNTLTMGKYFISFERKISPKEDVIPKTTFKYVQSRVSLVSNEMLSSLLAKYTARMPSA